MDRGQSISSDLVREAVTGPRIGDAVGAVAGTTVLGGMVVALPILVAGAMVWTFGPLGLAMCFLAVAGYVAGLRHLPPDCGRRGDGAGTSANVPTRRRVCVLGGGPSGLCTLKELRAEGHDAVCFERQESLGGIFTMPSMHPAFRFTSSPQITAFSDHPPADDDQRHWTNGDYVAYLHGYADRFSLWPHLHLGTEVTGLGWDGAVWTVEARDQRTGVITRHGGFDSIAVCSGTHAGPVSPALPERERYAGSIVHAADLRWRPGGQLETMDLTGKTVVVVGIGETAADLIDAVIDAGAAQCLLSTRNGHGAFVIPRYNPRTQMPFDYDTNRLRYALPKWLHGRISLYSRRIRAFFGRDPYMKMRAEFLARSGRLALNQFATKSNRLIPHLVDGTCRQRTDISGFDGGTTVRFADGQTDSVDLIVLCTGYRPAILPIADSVPHVEAKPARRYLRMFDPAWRDRIAFIAFARPAIGAIPPVAEMQARLFALVCSGRRVLPDLPTMRASIERADAALKRDFGPTDGEKLINWIPYMDRLATEIGCRPPLSLWSRAPGVALRVIAGGCYTAQYRLQGPGAAPDAAAAVIRSVPLGMAPRTIVFFSAMHLYAAVADLFGLRSLWAKHSRCSLY